MLEGYDALRDRAAWLDLSGRGRIAVTGRDRARLLHNLTTNHVKQLTPGAGCYAFLLTPQGRIQADIDILAFDDRFLLGTEPETRERVPELIRKYIIADQVTLEDISGTLAELAVEGPRAADILASAAAPAPDVPWSHAAWNGAIVAAITSTGQPGYRIYVPSDRRAEFIGRLQNAGAEAASAGAARALRIENGIPRYGEDIFETSLPQETRQLHALHFNKGCYLGQEIVERIRARGHVNKLLVKVRIDGAELPQPGAKLEAAGAEAGGITSAAFSPAGDHVSALAYVRATHAQPGTELNVDGRRAVVA